MSGPQAVRSYAAARLALIALLLASAAPLQAIHPNHPIGSDPERANGPTALGIDSIDLFSGSLSLSFPIGPFTLHYSSNVWRYEGVVIGGTERIEAFPDRTANAGLGWYLGWGEVYHESHGLNDTGRWLYIGEDGSRRVFYSSLHKDDGNAEPGVFYTRDGSYLRLRKWNNYFVDIELPDGATRRFDSGTGGLQTTYRLAKGWSPFNSAQDPDFTVTYNVDPADPNNVLDTLRTVTDRYGRSHFVHLTDEYPWINRVITRIEVEGQGGTLVPFDFFYDAIHVNRSCKDDSPDTSPRIVVPHLREIRLPDGTAYKMKKSGELLYYNLCKNEQNETVDDIPGVLNGLELPTGGAIRWAFQEYEFPPGDTNSVFNTSAGVEFRTLRDAAGADAGTWRYKTSSFNPGNGDDPEVYTEVVYPPTDGTSDCTKHYFDARYWVTPSQNKGWEYGLPFVYSREQGGKYLSHEVWSSHTGNGSCAGEVLRSTYLRFRHDPPPGTAPNPTTGVRLVDFYNTNRQAEATRVVYDDDGGTYADTERSEFDGLGHFRRTVETGTFDPASPSAERRERYVDFDRTTGSYPGSYQPVAPEEPWILGIFSRVDDLENDAHGESAARTELGFERDTGFLFCARTLASGTARSGRDLLTVQLRDALGQVTDVKRYGGDNQTLSTAGDDCGNLPAQPAYWTRNEYQLGEVVKTVPRTPGGVDGPFPTYDVDLEPSTGWVLRQRDSAGYQVEFDYDEWGRVTAITPQDGGRVFYDYVPASPGVQATITTTTLPATGSTLLAGRQVVFDDFGRPRLERRLLPEGVIAERETERNARGWTTAISQWGDLAKRTRFLDFDPFGRPRTIRPPDGAGHDVKVTYLGEREVVREMKLALASGEAYAPTVLRYDRYRRLRMVEELSGPFDPADPSLQWTPTTYRYDVGGRVTHIETGVAPTQVRTMTFDNRGFLLAESLPEKGATGNGTVSYLDYDAAGLPLRMVDGSRDIGYQYDFMGRQTRVVDRAHGDRLLTELVWDSAPGFGEGKLWYAMEHNWIDLPWNAQGEEDVKVRKLFRYQAKGGAVSRLETRILWSLDTVDFRHEPSYDDLGKVSSLRYPRCTLPASCASSDAGAVRDVGFVHDAGYLQAVPGWVDQIDYHTSGTWKQLHHANGVDDHFVQDPSFTRRPQRLYTSGVAGGADFDTGTMLYDGAGFLSAIGGDDYAYDEVGRLVDASLYDGVVEQAYQYDRFGNLLAIDGFSIGTYPFTVDSTTNRLQGDAVYDDAGNLLDWGPYHWRYDASNRVVVQNHMRYLYDAFGERVASIANAGLGYVNALFHLRGLGHRRLSTIGLDQSQTWRHERDYVYAGDRLLASSENGAAGADHYHLDHLGSTRLITAANAAVDRQLDFLPYGEELYGSYGDSVMFTGHERDFSTGADYMHARHYHFNAGRFTSVDPAPPDLRRPLSLNRYAYVLGNPLNYFDPTGLDDENPRSDEEDEDLPEFFDTVDVVDSFDPFDFIVYFGFGFPELRWRAADVHFISFGPGGRLFPGGRGPGRRNRDRGTEDGDQPGANLGGDDGGEGGDDGDAEEDGVMDVEISYFDLARIWQLSTMGLAAFADGVLPVWDPLEDAGVYDANYMGLEYSRDVGAYTRNIELALAATPSRVLFGRGSWMNTGRWFRLGHSSHRGATNFSLRGQAISSRGKHIDLFRFGGRR